METRDANLRAFAEKQIQDSCDIKRRLDSSLLDKLCSIAERTADILLAGGCVFFCGNGGSAGDAQHLAAEFVGRFQGERGALPALSLATNVSLLTAVANDYGYEHIFSRQIEALAKSGDILFLISTSGNSKNVLLAAEKARAQGIFTVGLTGATGGHLRDAVDLLINVPSSDTQRIQETHILLGHIYCGAVELAITSRKRQHAAST